MEFIKKLYITFTGYSYTNLGRLFLRLFAGIMLMQFGIRQMFHFSESLGYVPSVWGMSPETTLILLLIVEIGCSLFIMFGFLTRMMVIPLIVAMITAESYLLGGFASNEAIYLLDWQQPVYLPILFLGYYFFLLIVGPGKISVDYFLSLHLIHSANKSESELEEV